MQISEIRDSVGQGLLDFAWRQWAQIGVSATVKGTDRWAVDPEALILFTIGIARCDPRLFDEMLDWMAFNHELLSTQRLRNLAGRFPLPSGLVAAVTAWTRQTEPAELTVSDQAGLVQGREPVFSPDVLAFVSKPDPTFARHGFIRPLAARTGKSHEPDSTLPINMAFRLRHLFGPGGRSETMRVLLTYPRGPLDTARIAGEAGFAKRNISDVLTSLTASGVIKAAWAGNERHFTAYRERWALLLDLADPADMPSFVSWVHLLPAALQIITWLDEKTGTAESEYLIASQARSLINRLTRDLEAADIDIPHRQSAHGTSYLPVFAETSNALLARLAATH
ncbi:MAG TPA: hypothetical protein VKU39_10325 [Streptosporangiaceae bacterium]|nr:hypothetical protein [Streptosporangiaceae bacterium]